MTASQTAAALAAAEARLAEMTAALAAATATKPKSGPRVWEPLTETEAAEAARVARPAVAPCLCGCGTPTKGRFAPGHDATHKERLRKTAAGTGQAATDAAAALATYGW